MRPWLRGGLLVQVTADSLTGHKGRRAERMAHMLLEKRWVHFLATDAHNTSSRPPRMREARDLVATKYGASYAHALCVTNPLAAFLGRQFEVEEEPRDIYDDPKDPTLWDRMKELLTRR
jgi:protein-tyrosine phosphatase